MAGIWYRAGTVSLTQGSKRVTGVGTTWLDQAAGPIAGNTFWGPDFKPYEVGQVISDTTLDLIENYTGTTATGVPYKINTTEKFSVASLAAQVIATLNYAQAQYANMSTWAAGDLAADVPVILPDGVTSKAVPNLAKMSESTASAASAASAAQATADDAQGAASAAQATAASAASAASAAQATADDVAEAVAALPGAPFSWRNRLINGAVVQVNQRGFSGSWASISDGAYGYDRWKKSGSNIVQVVEAGGFRPNTLHTLSGTNVTTTQITSPASGNWTITVPNTARDVMLEEGTVATLFEVRPYAIELFLCQRYYETGYFYSVGYVGGGAAGQVLSPITLKSVKRVVPSVTLSSLVYGNASAAAAQAVKADIVWVSCTGVATTAAYVHGVYSASAEL